MSRLWVLITAFVLASPLAQGAEPAAPKKPLSAEAIWELSRLGPPSVSPDGRWAVLAVTAFDIKADKPTATLWLVPTAGGEARQLTFPAGSDSSPVWSPDGKWIAFAAKRGDGETAQLYAIPLDGGEARRLTSVPGGVFAPKWFPDSKRIAFATWVLPDWKGWEEESRQAKDRKESKMTGRVWTKSPARHWDRLMDERKAHLFTASLGQKDPTPLTLASGLSLPFGPVSADPDAAEYDISPTAPRSPSARTATSPAWIRIGTST